MQTGSKQLNPALLIGYIDDKSGKKRKTMSHSTSKKSNGEGRKMNKRFISLSLLMFSIAVLSGIFTSVQAATADTFQVSFSCNRVVDVVCSTDNVSTAAYEPRINFGLVNTAAQVIASTQVFVHNTSNANTAAIQNYGIYVSTNTGNTYTLNTGSFAGGEDSYAVAAIFRPSYPANSDFAADDLLHTTLPADIWNATVFNPATNAYNNSPTTNANVGAHARGDTAAYLWISIQTPTAVSNATAQTIGLTVIAE